MGTGGGGGSIVFGMLLLLLLLLCEYSGFSLFRNGCTKRSSPTSHHCEIENCVFFSESQRAVFWRIWWVSNGLSMKEMKWEMKRRQIKRSRSRGCSVFFSFFLMAPKRWLLIWKALTVAAKILKPFLSHLLLRNQTKYHLCTHRETLRWVMVWRVILIVKMW